MTSPICPGCGRTVALRPAAPATNGRGAVGPRRRAHAVEGDLAARGAVRCRYPVSDDPTTIPPEEP